MESVDAFHMEVAEGFLSRVIPQVLRRTCPNPSIFQRALKEWRARCIRLRQSVLQHEAINLVAEAGEMKWILHRRSKGETNTHSHLYATQYVRVPFEHVIQADARGFGKRHYDLDRGFALVPVCMLPLVLAHAQVEDPWTEGGDAFTPPSIDVPMDKRVKRILLPLVKRFVEDLVECVEPLTPTRDKSVGSLPPPKCISDVLTEGPHLKYSQRIPFFISLVGLGMDNDPRVMQRLETIWARNYGSRGATAVKQETRSHRSSIKSFRRRAHTGSNGAHCDHMMREGLCPFIQTRGLITPQDRESARVDCLVHHRVSGVDGGGVGAVSRAMVQRHMQ
jgi:hypothetical protein